MARERRFALQQSASAPRASTASRASNRGVARAAQNDRLRIAQLAARFIAEHGITDWALAKRKAARSLMLPESGMLPSNDELMQALTEYHALYGGAAHADTLRQQREEALTWMERLAAWQPMLVGGVAAGWASAHSDVRLELVADDPKTVEILLASRGIGYAALSPHTEDDRLGGAELRVDSAHPPIRLSILTPQQRRQRPRRADEPRLNIDELRALLAVA